MVMMLGDAYGVPPRWASANAAILEGDVRDVLPRMPADSVDCVVTSPPYWALRDYGTATWSGGDPACDHRRKITPRAARRKPGDTARIAAGGPTNDAQDVGSATYLERCGRCGAERVDRQLGLEPTATEYIANLVGIFAEVRRILKPNGTLWLNIGDTWANDAKWGGGNDDDHAPRTRRSSGVKEKEIAGIPYALGRALSDDGWYWRQAIVWVKPNAMPESVKDRLTNSYEIVLLMSKAPRYHFDWYAIAEPVTESTAERMAQNVAAQAGSLRVPGKTNGPMRAQGGTDGLRQKRDVWVIPTVGSEYSHYATFPPALVEPCILAGTSAYGNCIECGRPWARVVKEETRVQGVRRTSVESKRDVGTYRREVQGWMPTCDHPEAPAAPAVVFDPFLGTGTTAATAVRLGRRGLGVELNPASCRDAERQIAAAELERSRHAGADEPIRAETVTDMGPLWSGHVA